MCLHHGTYWLGGAERAGDGVCNKAIGQNDTWQEKQLNHKRAHESEKKNHDHNIQQIPGLASGWACCCCWVTNGVCWIPCVVIGADVWSPCTPIGAGWMPWAAIGAGWIPWVLICADWRPIRSTAISCMWLRWTVVATPTPAWVGSAELGAWGVTNKKRKNSQLISYFTHISCHIELFCQYILKCDVNI